ncbi:MAG: hypothetical protein NT147_00780, partial [Candidatus Aminicenantes bacterium]|nr:hypothetical protein [Candidatus Aminicenantes bacterium]
MRRCGQKVVLMWALSWLAACAPMKKAAVEPATSLPPVDWAAKISQADSLFAKGHYTAIKDALRIYKGALEVPAWRAAVAEKYVRSAIAFGLREKELGILAPVIGMGGTMTGTDDLAGFVTSEPSLAAYASWLELLAGLPNKIKGM